MKGMWKIVMMVAGALVAVGIAVGAVGFGMAGFDPTRAAAETWAAQAPIADQAARHGAYLFGRSPADYGHGDADGALIDLSGLSSDAPDASDAASAPDADETAAASDAPGAPSAHKAPAASPSYEEHVRRQRELDAERRAQEDEDARDAEQDALDAEFEARRQALDAEYRARQEALDAEGAA